jgi:hypothetical protein
MATGEYRDNINRECIHSEKNVHQKTFTASVFILNADNSKSFIANDVCSECYLSRTLYRENIYRE